MSELKRQNAIMLAALQRIDRINGSTGGAGSLVIEFKTIAKLALSHVER